jgi:branched-chain amino acid transport system permease protein
MGILALISLSIARYIQDSYLGQGLRAVRDSEEAAECSGVPTLRIKLVACTVMGALMGVAGAPMPMYMAYVEPVSSFNLNYSISALAMPIIGGTSHWLGPLIGALLLGALQQMVSVTISSELNVLVVGLLLVLFVVLAPEGILGLVKKWKQSSK